MSFGLCVLGCGSFARVFAESIAQLRGDIDLYFASRDLARAREYADLFDAAGAFSNYTDAAADSRVDALYVCTPHHLHREHVALAARNGKHALVEKPIASTLADAEAMVRETEAAGVSLMVAENYRFMPTVREARKLLDQGSLGQVRLIQLQEQFPYRPTGWRNRREFNGGGVLIDGGIHKLSVLAYLVGQPCEIYAREVLPGQPGLGCGRWCCNRGNDPGRRGWCHQSLLERGSCNPAVVGFHFGNGGLVALRAGPAPAQPT